MKSFLMRGFYPSVPGDLMIGDKGNKIESQFSCAPHSTSVPINTDKSLAKAAKSLARIGVLSRLDLVSEVKCVRYLPTYTKGTH